MNSHPDAILRVSSLTKTFAGVKALDNVQLTVRKGEVHALMGENGAGKSTLMKILVGLETPDAGTIEFDGSELPISQVRKVMNRGIAMVHQEVLLVPELTVVQNIFLGRETGGNLFSWLNDRRLTHQAQQLLTRMGVSIRPDAKMKFLSVAEKQMVEIAKALSNQAKVIIMDEPTSALSENEIKTLFRLINDLTAEGVAIIYISHKMEEIFAIADQITVLRDGQYIGTYPAADLDEPALITKMVGRQIDSLFPKVFVQRGNPVLSVKHLSRRGQFSNIHFDVHEGEVLGIAGLMGAGRTEIARVLYGLDRADEGEIYYKGEFVRFRSPQEAIQKGIGYVSEDRKEFGFIPLLSVKENITLSSLRKYARNGLVREDSEVEVAETMANQLKVKATNLDQPVMYLSGGNQQKVVIGNVLLSSPSLIILDEPTRGIDIGAKAEIYALISQLKADGIAIILISSELPELLGLSDRILILAKGKQTALLATKETTQETIMHYAMQG